MVVLQTHCRVSVWGRSCYQVSTVLIAIVHNWVICQVYCSQTIKLSVSSIAEVATDPGRTGSDPDLAVFFFRSRSDSNPVSLEDPDMKLALPLQIIWGQNQHCIPQRPFSFGLHLNIGKKCPNFQLRLFLFFGLYLNFGKKKTPQFLVKTFFFYFLVFNRIWAEKRPSF